MSIYSVNSEKAIIQEQINPEQFLDLATELFSVIVFIYDPESRKLQYSYRQLHAILGYDANALLNTELFDIQGIFHSDDLPHFRELLEASEESERIAREAVCRLRDKEGAYHSFLLKARRLTSNGKKYFVVPATKLEASFIRPRQQEEALRTTINELKQANRELEDFAYVASHDLQEPLRKITTFSSRLTEKYKHALPGEGNMYLERIVASANNMRQFIDSLLEFSRISRVKSPFKETDLNFIVKQVQSELELVIEETGCEIHNTGLPKLNASSTQMKQLFTNLIGNGIKFSRKGVAPLISIQASIATEEEIAMHRLTPGVFYHKIKVEDNGIGFDPEYAAQIFQMFQRLHGKSEYPGSGIGLAICKKITEYHKGTIFAESTPGNGACFTILLPEDQTK